MEAWVDGVGSAKTMSEIGQEDTIETDDSQMQGDGLVHEGVDDTPPKEKAMMLCRAGLT